MISNMKLFQKSKHTGKGIDPDASIIIGLFLLLSGLLVIVTGAYSVAVAPVGVGFMAVAQGIANRKKSSSEQDHKACNDSRNLDQD